MIHPLVTTSVKTRDFVDWGLMFELVIYDRYFSIALSVEFPEFCPRGGRACNWWILLQRRRRGRLTVVFRAHPGSMDQMQPVHRRVITCAACCVARRGWSSLYCWYYERHAWRRPARFHQQYCRLYAAVSPRRTVTVKALARPLANTGSIIVDISPTNVALSCNGRHGDCFTGS